VANRYADVLSKMDYTYFSERADELVRQALEASSIQSAEQLCHKMIGQIAPEVLEISV
jgi:hypothetical protein